MDPPHTPKSNPPRSPAPSAAGLGDAYSEFNAMLSKLGVESLLSKASPCRENPRAGSTCFVVETAWHYQPEGARKDFATALWQAWAVVCTKHRLADKVDSCRIKLLSPAGREVGGSRALAGSLIWVEE